MRLLPPVLIACVAAALATTSAIGQRPDDQLIPRSVELLRQGQVHLSAGRFVEADEAFETALAVDPRNRAAYIALARVAQREKLFGQSIRFTKKALLLEPNDRDAIAIQGESMVELGALARAKDNLVKLQKLCPGGCAQLSELSATISRGPTVASAKPPEVPKSN
ncbi:MAG: tetratricopeptide repeat protein [Sphingomonas sp.]|jgi:tetratricopeptide (TPR) repeat protein|nr:tetratricopeptide repeat protein [Sphingomonas sp.]